MAYADIIATRRFSRVYTMVSQEVFAKRRWDDGWTWLPFVYPVQVEEAAAPTMERAVLQYDFGLIARAELGYFDIWRPYFLAGAYVAIVVYNRWGSALLWTGTVDAETVTPDGSVNWPQGQQQFTVMGLGHVLDRRPMMGAYTVDGFIDRPMPFNRRSSQGLGIQGNLSNVLVNGYIVFGSGATWTARDIAIYGVQQYVNETPYGLPEGGPLFVLVGDLAALDYEDTWDFDGMTTWEILNRLVDRRKGVGMRLLSTGSGLVYILVYSLLSTPLRVGGANVGANPYQGVASFAGENALQHELTFNDLARHDHIVARGGPLFSAFTLSFADGTLIEGWGPSQETAYKAGSSVEGAGPQEHDGERRTEKFNAVYQRFIVPLNWNGVVKDGENGLEQVGLPFVDLGGNVITDVIGNFHRRGKSFERVLPFAEESASGFDEEYRRPFVLAKITITSEDEEVEDRELWAFVDELDAFEDGGFRSMSVDMVDNDLGVVVRPSRVNHELGLNHFDAEAEGTAETAKGPRVDYETLLATVMLETDQFMKVEVFANGRGPGETGRTKLVDLPDAQAWYVAPGTVVDVADGDLVRHEGGFERNDVGRLYSAAALAIAWYGTPRATLAYEVDGLSLAWPVGYMIAGVVGPEGYTAVNTVVSRRTWTFSREGIRTSVQTGYEELDIVGSA